MPNTSAVLDLFSSVYNCSAGIVVGNLVYIDATDHVALADSGSSGTMPAIGVVVSKPTTTTCVVQYGGEVTGLTVVAGTLYYVGAAGALASSAGVVTQGVGIAKNATTLVLFAIPGVATGPQGPQGTQGHQGNQGAQGPQGVQAP